MRPFAEWLSSTPVSVLIQDVLWIVPTVQTIHIVAIAIVMGSVFLIDLRVLGVAGQSQSMSETAGRFLPWLWGGLVVLAASGLILITGEPVRSLVNWAFWTKMSLLAAAIAVTLVFQGSLRRRMALWEQPAGQPATFKLFAVATFLLWCAIAVAGRWIAYVDVP